MFLDLFPAAPDPNLNPELPLDLFRDLFPALKPTKRTKLAKPPVVTWLAQIDASPHQGSAVVALSGTLPAVRAGAAMGAAVRAAGAMGAVAMGAAARAPARAPAQPPPPL